MQCKCNRKKDTVTHSPSAVRTWHGKQRQQGFRVEPANPNLGPFQSKKMAVVVPRSAHPNVHVLRVVTRRSRLHGDMHTHTHTHTQPCTGSRCTSLRRPGRQQPYVWIRISTESKYEAWTRGPCTILTKADGFTGCHTPSAQHSTAHQTPHSCTLEKQHQPATCYTVMCTCRGALGVVA